MSNMKVLQIIMLVPVTLLSRISISSGQFQQQQQQFSLRNHGSIGLLFPTAQESSTHALKVVRPPGPAIHSTNEAAAAVVSSTTYSTQQRSIELPTTDGKLRIFVHNYPLVVEKHVSARPNSNRSSDSASSSTTRTAASSSTHAHDLASYPPPNAQMGQQEQVSYFPTNEGQPFVPQILHPQPQELNIGKHLAGLRYKGRRLGHGHPNPTHQVPQAQQGIYTYSNAIQVDPEKNSISSGDSDGIPIQLRGTVDYGPVNYGAPSFTMPPQNYGGEVDDPWNSNGGGPGPGGPGNNGIVQGQGLPPPVTGFAYKPMYDLDNLNIFRDTITLSGHSSGGGLAQQLLVSHPSLFSGIAVFQQTFYRCGRGNGIVTEFDNFCTNLGNQSMRHSYDPQLAINDINSYFRHGLIEDPKLLQDKRLYLYVGLQNMIFKPYMMLNVLRVFEPFITNPLSIRTRVQSAANLLPTSNFGHHCDQDATSSYLLGNCNLNGAYEALSFLIGSGTIKLPADVEKADMDSLLEFDQSEFFHGIPGEHFMANTGYIYIPRQCGPLSDTRCHLHIYFHGCGAGSDLTKGNHIRYSGFLEVAEENHVVVIFPQVRSDERNPLGCWDSYGYTGPLYATQQGLQIMIIRKMLERILQSDKNGLGKL